MNPRQVVSFVLHLYWRLFRPKSFGVKAIIMHPDNPDLCLVVQHNYGNQFAWNLPGGGYQPAHESPEQAIIRELREELGVVATVKLRLDDYYTDAQGKRDTVSLFICTTDTLAFSLNHELKVVAWHSMAKIANDKAYYRIVRYAIGLCLASPRP